MAARESSGRGTVTRTDLWEVLVFVSLLLPSMLLSFFAVRQGHLGFVLIATATMLRDGALVGLIIFLLWRTGAPMARIGWASRRTGTKIILGMGCFVVLSFTTLLLEGVLRVAGVSAPSTPLPRWKPGGPVELLLATLLVVVVAVAEETIFRGYLILRFEAITGRPAIAVILLATLFALGHGYEGTAAAVAVGIMGVALALVSSGGGAS
jgi:membrane protease YdiL (CAAX protease family)